MSKNKINPEVITSNLYTSNISVGDTIYSIMGDKYTVKDIKLEQPDFPIYIGNSKGEVMYINSGVNQHGVEVWCLNNPAKRKKFIPIIFNIKPNIKLDAYIQDNYGIKEISHFSHMDTNNVLWVFKYGCDSITSLRKSSKIMVKRVRSYTILTPADIIDIVEATG